MSLRALLAALLTLGAGACQSSAAERPAVLAGADAETLARVEAALAGAMGVAQVELGAGDLTQTSVVSVLPPPLGPLEGRSPATPIVFDLVLRGGACFAVRRETGEAFELAGVACRPRVD